MKSIFFVSLISLAACSDQQEHPMQNQMRALEKANQVDQMMQNRVNELNQKMEQ